MTKKATAPIGRPPSPDARHYQLPLRLTEEERAELERVAAADDLKPSTWARAAILRALRKAGSR